MWYLPSTGPTIGPFHVLSAVQVWCGVHTQLFRWCVCFWVTVQRAGVRAAVVVTVKRLVFSSTDVDELSILANLRALGRAAVQTSALLCVALHTCM